MGSNQQEIASLWRWLAYGWYIWGQSCCYWGVRTAEQTLFRLGIAAFDRAIRIWPGFASAWYRRGLIRGRELGQYREANDDLTRAIELNPEWPDPYLQRGLFQRFHGDPHAAIADLQQYLAHGGELYWRIEAERQIGQLRAELADHLTDSERSE